MVGRRGDDAHELRSAFLGRANADDFQPIRFALQLRPIAGELLIVGEAIIVAQVEAQIFLRSRDPRSRLGRLRRARNSGEKQAAKQENRLERRETAASAWNHRSLSFKTSAEIAHCISL